MWMGLNLKPSLQTSNVKLILLRYDGGEVVQGRVHVTDIFELDRVDFDGVCCSVGMVDVGQVGFQVICPFTLVGVEGRFVFVDPVDFLARLENEVIADAGIFFDIQGEAHVLDTVGIVHGLHGTEGIHIGIGDAVRTGADDPIAAGVIDQCLGIHGTGCQAAQGQEQGCAERRHFFHHYHPSFLVFDALIVYPYYIMRNSLATSEEAGLP
mgnify:CR=1 FL=1